MKLQFQIPTHENRVYVGDEWISNGHWMIRKRAAMHVPSLKSVMKKWMSVIPGAYEAGEHLPDVNLPEFERVIASVTSGDGYIEAVLSGRVVYNKTTVLPEIRAVFLEAENGARAAIATRYAGLLAMGKPHIKDSTSPVIIRDGAGEVAAIIMPRREEP